MNQDEWEEEAARILQEEIDREVIMELSIKNLVSQGWTSVEVGAGIEDFNEIDQWIRENIGASSCEYHWIYDIWAFKHSDDATLFKLKWL
jgi:hypothetical protein